MIELTFVTLFSFCLFPKRQECHSQNGIRGQKEAKRSGQIINGTDSEADKGCGYDDRVILVGNIKKIGFLVTLHVKIDQPSVVDCTSFEKN